MRSRTHRSDLAVNAEINLVNLVDLAFVLLIIFIITAPILQGGIDVKLPSANATPLPQEEGLIITIDRSGRIFIGEVAVQDYEEFERLLPSHASARENRVYLKGDADVPYGVVMKVMGIMGKLDIQNAGMVVDPEVER